MTTRVRDDGVVEHDALDHEQQEHVLGYDDMGQRDPRRDGTVTASVPIALVDAPPAAPPPADHPASASRLLAAHHHSDLVIARDLDSLNLPDQRRLHP